VSVETANLNLNLGMNDHQAAYVILIIVAYFLAKYVVHVLQARMATDESLRLNRAMINDNFHNEINRKKHGIS
jgi:hypothetical protein